MTDAEVAFQHQMQAVMDGFTGQCLGAFRDWLRRERVEVIGIDLIADDGFVTVKCRGGTSRAFGHDFDLPPRLLESLYLTLAAAHESLAVTRH